MPSIPERCDVVVIGGGPTGSIAGALLARKGYDVVLFDKERHPRYRVGESVIPHIWKFTDLAGASDKLMADQFVQKAGGTVVWNGVIRQMAFKDFGYDRPALHVERDRFDKILLDHARACGVQVFEETAVLRGTFDGPGATSVDYRLVADRTPGTISCRQVIDASGQNAVLGKQFKLRQIDDAFRFMSIWGYWENSKYVGSEGKVYPFDQIREHPPTTFVSSIDDVGDWGWLWHIPQRDETSIGMVLPQDAVKAIKGDGGALEAFFQRKCREIPYLKEMLEGAGYREGSFHVIRDYSYRSTDVTGPGFYLAGDAAAFVDPIFSVGVLFGMFTGYLSSWAVDRTLQKPSSAERNARIYARQLEARLEVSRTLALPQYSSQEAASELARRTVHFESAREQELMYVVSTFTTRNDNVKGMVQDRDGHDITSENFRILEEIAF